MANVEMRTKQLWIERDGRRCLLGTRCRACGAISFPPANDCIACGAAEPTREELAARGTIESRTQLGERIVCEIRLQRGPLVMGWLPVGQGAEIGAAVRLEPVGDELRFVPDV